MRYLKLPLGMSDFEEIRQNGYYYIDKSGLISDLLVRKAAKVTLITRPRRFGKTLGMSMLAHFFDIEKVILSQKKKNIIMKGAIHAKNILISSKKTYEKMVKSSVWSP